MFQWNINVIICILVFTKRMKPLDKVPVKVIFQHAKFIQTFVSQRSVTN